MLSPNCVMYIIVYLMWRSACLSLTVVSISFCPQWLQRKLWALIELGDSRSTGLNSGEYVHFGIFWRFLQGWEICLEPLRVEWWGRTRG